MKLLVVSDYYMYSHNGKYYFQSKEKYDFFYRYLRVFENIKIVTRCIQESVLKKERILLDEESIEYCPIPEFHGLVQYLKKYFMVGKVINKVLEGCDAVVMQLPSTISQRIAPIVMKSGIPYAVEVVYDAQDGWVSETNIVTKLLWKQIDILMRKICDHADGVACVTEFYLQKHYFSTKTNHFVSNYSSLALDKSFYSSPRIYPHNKRIVIAHVANKIFYDGRKGHKELVRAIGILKAKGIVVDVKFAAELVGDNKERLLELAQTFKVDKQLNFCGFLNRDELNKFLTTADLFVLPTKAEGLPRVVIEAMAKGLPCVSTMVSGNSELISKDYLIDYDDVNALAQKIEKFVMNSALYEEVSKENYKRSLQYEASILEKKRDLFYSSLKSLCK